MASNATRGSRRGPLAVLLTVLLALAAAVPTAGAQVLDGADEPELAPQALEQQVQSEQLADAAAEAAEPTAPGPDAPSDAASDDRAGGVVVRGSARQLSVIGAVPGSPAVAAGPGGATLSATTDGQGGQLWRDVAPGAWEVTAQGPDGPVTATVTVTTGDEPPPVELYDAQQLDPGYGYLTTRDGTTLAINVVLPGPVEDGPYPTVVEYSGYDPANPTQTIGSLLGEDIPADECPWWVGLISDVLCTPPAQPSSLTASALGYAVVGVNVRGTGCSGGAYDFFDLQQRLDGYDVVETVARQPWVAGGHVGMVGLSYPGIAQLFVAAQQPPSLAAIAPQSVLTDAYRGVLHPGGIYNNGFAREWSERVLADAEPFGQGWEQLLVDAGDTTCADNQRLRDQNRAITQLAADAVFSDDPLYADYASDELLGSIDVPVLVTGQFQDEQTGPWFANDLDQLDQAPFVKVLLSNGLHPDGYSAAAVTRWFEFLEVFVAERTPRLPDLSDLFVALVSNQAFGTLQFPDRARLEAVDSLEEARQRLESEPPVEVWFESGADLLQPGAPGPRFVRGFDAWPPPQAEPWTWYLRDDGDLSPWRAWRNGATSSFTGDAGEHTTTTFAGDDDALWRAGARYDWEPSADGASLTFTTRPLFGTVVLAGTASVDLWVRTGAADVDLEVTLSEVRADGREVKVQDGWLRASRRALDPDRSTALLPVPTHRAADAAPLTAGEPTLVRVATNPFAHVARFGSRLRLTVSAPGASQPRWTFAALDPAPVTILHDRSRPSRLVLPRVRDVDAPWIGPWPCDLRGQPCR